MFRTQVTIVVLFLIPFSVSAQSGISIIEENKAYREKLNEEYRSEKSPLKEKDKAEFKTLPFFPIDTNFHVVARFERVKNSKPFKMKTSTSSKPTYELYGKVHFAINGKELSLNVYQSHRLRAMKMYKDFLFLPFTDRTTGNESYGGGRYIDMRIPKKKRVVIDFNKAYNPYCAYSSGYSCPIPPKENFLDVRVTAGVKHEGH